MPASTPPSPAVGPGAPPRGDSYSIPAQDALEPAVEPLVFHKVLEENRPTITPQASFRHERSAGLAGSAHLGEKLGDGRNVGGDLSGGETRMNQERPASADRNQLGVMSDSRASVAATREWIESTGVKGASTFRETGFRNHNDEWVLRPSPARAALREWVRAVMK